jgi:hypothetical protein
MNVSIFLATADASSEINSSVTEFTARSYAEFESVRSWAYPSSEKLSKPCEKPLTKSEMDMSELQEESSSLAQDTRTDKAPKEKTAIHREILRGANTHPFCQYRTGQRSHLQFQYEQD